MKMLSVLNALFQDRVKRRLGMLALGCLMAWMGVSGVISQRAEAQSTVRSAHDVPSVTVFRSTDPDPYYTDWRTYRSGAVVTTRRPLIDEGSSTWDPADYPPSWSDVPYVDRGDTLTYEAAPTRTYRYDLDTPPVLQDGWGPVTTYRPVAPSRVTTYSPYTVYAQPAPLVVPPTTSVAPSSWLVPVPTTVYRPVSPLVVPPAVGYTTAAPLPGAVPVGPAVVVRPKVYYPGQPLRNALRAITP